MAMPSWSQREDDALRIEALERAQRNGRSPIEEYQRLRYEYMQMSNPMYYNPTPNPYAAGMYAPGLSGLSPAPSVPFVPPPKKPPVDMDLLAKLKTAEPHQVLRPTPDYTEIMVGWRAWRSAEVNGEWRLKALGKDTIWEPKAKIEAKCDGYSKGHPAPHKSCECGVWSFSSLEKLVTALEGYTDQKIVGQVHIWGRVIECENGFRSQFAYPKELWLLDESMEQLGYIYGVPIRTAK